MDALPHSHVLWFWSPDEQFLFRGEELPVLRKPQCDIIFWYGLVDRMGIRGDAIDLPMCLFLPCMAWSDILPADRPVMILFAASVSLERSVTCTIFVLLLILVFL